MSCLPRVFLQVSLLHSVLGSLPAPVNVSMDSVNFHHVLRWDPGPGTPPGTRYNILRLTDKNKLLKSTNMTSVKLTLKLFRETHSLAVRAVYNQTLFSELRRFTFTPYGQTIIGPPKLSLAGCGNCIEVNISLPKPPKNSKIDDIHNILGPQYQVSWKKRDGKMEKPFYTPNKTFTLPNLERGTEYCVQVHPHARVNKNTKTSAWECVFTSAVEPSRGPVVLGAVIAPLILVFGALMTIMLLLYYTGFICKLKATLPRVLNAALSRGYTLTPERTIPDHIYISPDVEKQRKRDNPTTPQPVARGPNLEEEYEEEDEEEEDEGINVYVNRLAGLSSGQTSSGDSGDASGNQSLTACGYLGSQTVEEEEAPVTESVVAHDEKNDVADLSLIPEGRQTGVQRHFLDEAVEEKAGKEEEEVEKEKKEVGDSSGNINLFSVTLGALAGCDEEEEQSTRDSLTDFLKLCDQELLLPADSQTADQTDVQTAALMLPTAAFTDTGHEGRGAHTLSDWDGETQPEEEEDDEEDEEEDDEEEFSGYMKHT